jgi:hypothetical protein
VAGSERIRNPDMVGRMAATWLSRAQDEQYIEALREALGQEEAHVLIFLGAGLSYGVGRFTGRRNFEFAGGRPDPHRFPAWAQLIERMKGIAVGTTSETLRQESIARFFADNDPLDCAQLFRSLVGEDNYVEFLTSQFETRPDDADLLTPSHEALVLLPAKTIFTTNYDELIELSFERWNGPLVVSSTLEEFQRNQVAYPEHHLVKLHGTISEPDSIVLTRDDYARSRQERQELFAHLAHEIRYTAFLFVGFSLTDPNFMIIRDQARVVMGENLPASYLVQEEPDPVMREYLDSIQVSTIGVTSWNAMPAVLAAIHPTAA